MRYSIIFFLLVILILSGCSSEPKARLAEGCHRTIEKMLDIQIKAKSELSYQIERELLEGELRQPNWFDVNEFFSALPHLEVQKGYAIDYIQFQSYDGAPFLYARKIGEYPYSSLDDLKKEYEQTWKNIYNSSGSPEVKEKAYWEYRYNYMNYIQINEFTQGYIEFLIFRIMGNQFYLMGHTNYNDVRPICTFDDLERAMRSFDAVGWDEDTKKPLKEEAHKIDLSPKVEYQRGIVIVKLFYFTQFGGLYKSETTIQRSFPHQIIKEEIEQIIKYNSGVRY